MSVIHAVQIFMLLWGFTTVCQAEPGVCSVRCNNVIGTVGEEVIFACSICEQSTKCCVTLHKFVYPEKYNHSNCKQELPNGTCEKRSIFTCRFTSDTAMNETFGFFVQVGNHGPKTAKFTVNISEPVKADAQGRTGKEPNPPVDATGQNQHRGSEEPGHENISGSAGSAVSAGVGCFIIFMIIIILTSIIIYKKHRDERKEESFQAVRPNNDDNNTQNVSFHCESDDCS